MTPNIRYINTTEMLLAKQRDRERRAQQRQDRIEDTLAWILALCISLTGILLLVAYQEGWLK